MAKLNKYMCMGNVASDPEMTYTSKGTPVTSFRIAVNEKFGEKERVLFLRCAAFGARAEVLAKYVTKGKPIYLEGSLTESSWTDDAGVKHSRVELEIRDFQFLGTPTKNDVPDIE